ncbi:translation initiation factor IF-5A [Candidatus Micrarchaeota archaeon]|nr:translation initiation factor IF-5A [Candidatus Micrarchaeota archaeon]
MPGEIQFGTVKELKEGKLVVIDGEPCRVVGIDLAKTGKHGSSKARVEAISLFTGNKKTLLKPSDATCEIPIIEKKAVQVVAITGDTMQLMDLQTFESFEMPIPDEYKGKIVQGGELEIQDVMGKKLLSRVK